MVAKTAFNKEVTNFYERLLENNIIQLYLVQITSMLLMYPCEPEFNIKLAIIGSTMVEQLTPDVKF